MPFPFRWPAAPFARWVGIVAIGACLVSGLVLSGQDERIRGLLANTLQLSFVTCCVSIPIATILAWLLFRTDVPGRRVALLVLLTLPVIPLYVQTAAWDAGFGSQGWLASLSNSHAAPWLKGMRGAIWVHTLAAIPCCVGIVGAGMWWGASAFEEDAQLSTTDWGVFRKVTLPNAVLAIAVAVVWTIVHVLGEVTVTDIYQVPTYAQELFVNFALADELGPDRNAATLRGLVAVLGGVASAALLGWCCLMRSPFQDVRRGTWRTRPLRLRGGRGRALMVITLAVVGLAVVPISNLIYQVGEVTTWRDGQAVTSWEAAKALVMTVTSPWENRDALGWSCTIAGVSAAVSVIGALMCVGWAGHSSARGALIATGAVIGLGVPAPLISILVLKGMHAGTGPGWTYWYDHTILAPCLALVLRSFPYALLILLAAVRTMGTSLLEAAELDGAGPWARYWHVTLPQRIPAVALAYGAAWIVAVGDLGASYAVLPPGIETLARRVLGWVHYGVEDQLAALCLSTWLLLMGLVAIVGWSAKPMWGSMSSGSPRTVRPKTLRLLVMVAGSLTAATGAGSERVRFSRDGKTHQVEGEPWVGAEDGGVLLLAPDGVLWMLQPDEIQTREKLDQPIPCLKRDALQARMLAELPPGFSAHHTAHYLICYNTSLGYAQWCGALYERLYRAFFNYWERRGIKLQEPKCPLVVVIFRDREQYTQHARGEVGDAVGSVVGFYSLLSNRVTMFDLTGAEELATTRSSSQSAAKVNQVLSLPNAMPMVATIVHEATHQLAFNSTMHARLADIPLWVSEGMAEFFEVPDLSSSKGWGGVGSINRPRFDRFRRYLSARPPGSLKSLIADNSRLRDPRQALDAYAEAWAFTYYLLRRHSQKYVVYLKALAEKEPLVEDSATERIRLLETTFGATVDELDAEFLRFIISLK